MPVTTLIDKHDPNNVLTYEGCSFSNKVDYARWKFEDLFDTFGKKGYEYDAYLAPKLEFNYGLKVNELQNLLFSELYEWADRVVSEMFELIPQKYKWVEKDIEVLNLV